MNDDQYTQAITYAHERGVADGLTGAAWYFDGSTERAIYERVLRGIEDGDPVILDTLPCPDCGQRAGNLSGPELVANALAEADVMDDRGLCPHDDGFLGPDWTDDILAAYEGAYVEAAHAEVERIARYHLGRD